GTVAEYLEMADRLNGVAGVSGIELNLSCPNVDGGLEFGTNPQLAAQVVSVVRRITALPLWVKLSPNVTDIVEIAQAVAEAGADALTLVNTLKGMAVDIKTRRPVLSTISGGLSGPAIKPVALYMVYQVAGAVGVPVIGCGGIGTADDALEFLMAGARAVQVGTATMIDPQSPLEILRGIEDFMDREGFTDLRQLIGVARV
ncbi:MAG: dihydroorotate dehydrogenase, partial [Chloroflexota bacterium]